MSDATEHDAAYDITLARVREVFHDVQLSRQEGSSLNVLLAKAIKRNAPDPVPKIEIEGIRELLGHIWNPAFNAINGD